MTKTALNVLKKSVFLVDDHPLVRDWLSRLINDEIDLVVCGSADKTEDAIVGIARLHPDVIIVDIGLRGKSGLE